MFLLFRVSRVQANDDAGNVIRLSKVESLLRLTVKVIDHAVCFIVILPYHYYCLPTFQLSKSSKENLLHLSQALEFNTEEALSRSVNCTYK